MLRQSADLALGRALGPSAAGTWGGWIAAAVLLGLGALVSSFGFKLLFFSLAAICLMTRVPRAVWLKLGEKARIRQR